MDESLKNIEKNFCTNEIAKQLKDLGFVELCGMIFRGDVFSTPALSDWYNHNSRSANTISAPLWSQTIDWLRENHDICVDIRTVTNLNVFDYRITFLHTDYENSFYDGIKPVCAFYTYSEAREAAILKAIELIKEK